MFLQCLKQSGAATRRSSNSKIHNFMGTNHSEMMSHAGQSFDALTLLLQIRGLLIDPLTNVISASELLGMQQDKLTQAQRDRAIERIKQSTWRILQLLDELTALAKAQSPTFEAEISLFNPVQLLDAIKYRCQPYAEQKGLTFEVITH